MLLKLPQGGMLCNHGLLIYLSYMVYEPNFGIFAFELYRRSNLLVGFTSSITQITTFHLMKLISVTKERSKLKGIGQL